MIHMVQVSHELVECTMSLANTLCYGGAIVFTMMVGVACVTAAGYPVAHYLLWPLELLPSMRSALCYAHGLPLAKLRCYRVNLPSSCSFGMLASIADQRNDSPQPSAASKALVSLDLPWWQRFCYHYDM